MIILIHNLFLKFILNSSQRTIILKKKNKYLNYLKKKKKLE
jgi:hypothetical protein